MKSTQILTRLAAIESEAKQLRAIIEEPKQRKPEAGDVWKGSSTTEWLVKDDGYGVCIKGSFSYNIGRIEKMDLINTVGAYLGKHHEVYCKRTDFIRDVRDALSHEDEDNESILSASTDGSYDYGVGRSQVALAKLGITK